MAQNPDRLQGGYADTLQVGERCYTYFPVSRIAGADRLPYSLPRRSGALFVNR